MTHDTRRTLAILIGIVGLYLALCSDSPAQETSLFSGRVIDEEGIPVAGVTVTLMPVEDGNGAWFPIQGDRSLDWPMEQPSFRAKTDAEGRWALTDAVAGPVLLTLRLSDSQKMRLLKAKIGGLSFYASGALIEHGIVFSAEPGAYVENIEITVRYPDIRGKILGIGGAAIADANLTLQMRLWGAKGEEFRGSQTVSTDAEGVFVKYLDRNMEGPILCALTVGHQGQSVMAKPITIEPGRKTRNLTFAFHDLLGVIPQQHAFGRISASASVYSGIDARGMWVVNPATGNAYKKIRFRGVEDAIFQASQEGADLVSINDEAEQKWLEQVFATTHTLIGLSDVAKEGEWQWHSGEPVTYTNWARHEPDDADGGDEDYVIFSFGGKWEDIGPGNVRWRMVRQVLLEKETPPVK